MDEARQAYEEALRIYEEFAWRDHEQYYGKVRRVRRNLNKLLGGAVAR
jgi:hypothetical protein